MIGSTSYYQGTYSRVISCICILIFGIIGGFFVNHFGIIPGYEWINIVIMLGIAGISYIPFIYRQKYKGFLLLLVSGITAVIIEYIGVHTCIPYGCFNYTDILGFKIAETVPYTVLIGRTPLILGVHTILGQYKISTAYKIILGAIVLTSIDLVLDPGAVALGFWKFHNPGRYYNIPRTNFIGRIVSGSIGIRQFQQLQNTNIHVSETYSLGLTLSFFTALSLWGGMWISGLIGVILLIIYIYHILR